MAPLTKPTYLPHDLARASYPATPTSSRRFRDPVPTGFDAATFTSAQAVATIRRAFLLAKTSHRDWSSYKREGRFDPRQAARASRSELDVFRRKTGRSTTRVRCAVMLDASGSMNAQDALIENPLDPAMKLRTNRRVAAAVFGALVAKALGTVPTIDLDVFQHTVGRSNEVVLKWRWAKGTPVQVFNAATRAVGGSGNADGHALFAVTERMRKSLKRDERGVIMMVSDGLPADYSGDGKSNAGQALIDAVAHARKHGITVIGVAIDGSDQTRYYGKDTITHDGSWSHLGANLAKVIGAALAKPR